MRNFAPTLLVAAMVSFGASLAHAQAVLRAEVQVEEDVVTLGDLFDGIEGNENMPILAAPGPGQRLLLTRPQIAQIARQGGVRFDARFAPEVVSIGRAATVVEPAQIKEQVEAALENAGAVGPLDVQMATQDLTLFLPSGEPATIDVKDVKYDFGSGKFSATLVTGLKKPVSREISGIATSMAEMPVLRRPLEPGMIVTADDVEWVKVRADRVGRGTFTHADDVIGKEIKHRIRPGQAISTKSLGIAAVVKKGEIVTITYRKEMTTGKLFLASSGRVLNDGAVGDVVDVENIQSRRKVQAHVVAAGHVMVPVNEQKIALAE